MSIKRSGFVVDVTGRTDHFSRPMANALQANLFSCSARGKKGMWLRVVRLSCYLRNLIFLVCRVRRSEWVIYNIPKFLLLEAVLIRYFTRGNCILLVHNQNLHHGRTPAWDTHFFLASFDAFICHSPDVQRALHHLVPQANVLLTPIPLSQSGSLAPSQYRIRSGKCGPLYVGFVGQLRRQKGVDLFYEAALRISQRHPGLMQFVIAGESIDFVPKNYNSEDHSVVIRNRFLEDEELHELLMALDVLVAPYRVSAGSAICALASHYELPVIASQLEVFEYMKNYYPFITTAKMNTVDEIIDTLLLRGPLVVADVAEIKWSQIRESMTMKMYAEQIMRHFSL